MEHRLKTTIAAVLGIDANALGEDASPETIANWDSVKQVDIILAVEDEFGVRFKDDEITALSSYARIRDTLAGMGIGRP